MTARITVGGVVLNGVGSVQYDGTSVVMSLPETGSVITRSSLSGRALRSIGSLRATGQEADRDLHLALNTGLPLIDPRGGFYFIFQTGVPLFRKYDGKGTLLFERHIEGREIDALLAAQPTKWPRRTNAQGEELPLVTPVVRTAAVDPSGNLWVAFERAVHLRLRPRRREVADRPVPRRRHPLADELRFLARWASARDARVLRVPGRAFALVARYERAKPAAVVQWPSWLFSDRCPRSGHYLTSDVCHHCRHRCGRDRPTSSQRPTILATG